MFVSLQRKQSVGCKEDLVNRMLNGWNITAASSLSCQKHNRAKIFSQMKIHKGIWKRVRDEYLENWVQLLLLRGNAERWQLSAFIETAICFSCGERWCCWREEQRSSQVEFMGIRKSISIYYPKEEWLPALHRHCTGTPARCLKHRAPVQPWANYLSWFFSLSRWFYFFMGEAELFWS